MFQTSAIRTKIELDGKLKEFSERVEKEERLKKYLVGQKVKLGGEVSELKKYIDNLELSVAKVEKDKHFVEKKMKNCTEEIPGFGGANRETSKRKQNLIFIRNKLKTWEVLFLTNKIH